MIYNGRRVGSQEAVPAWARELVERVSRDYAKEGAPEVYWLNVPRSGSSGCTWSFGGWENHEGMTDSSKKKSRPWHEIVISVHAGTGIGAKMVLLHELAHALTPGDSHTHRFWKQAWQLYFSYGLPDMAHAMRSEDRYMAKSAVARRAVEMERTSTRKRAAASGDLFENYGECRLCMRLFHTNAGRNSHAEMHERKGEANYSGSKPRRWQIIPKTERVKKAG